jgi:two-component system response regulator DesR
MTTFPKSGYIKRAMAMGVKAFILKESLTEYLSTPLKKVHNGERVIDPELALMALDDNDPLSRT